MNKSIVIVDDHTMMREGIQAWIEKNMDWKISGSLGNIKDTLQLLKDLFERNLFPEICIIDIDLGEENGFDLAKQLLVNYPSVKIIMYSMHQEQVYAAQAKELGIHAYISKAAHAEEFGKCIQAVTEGKEYLEETMVQKHEQLKDILSFLTKKEQLVFLEILKGRSNEQISELLTLTPHTIEVYVSKIYDKLGLRSRIELIKMFG